MVKNTTSGSLSGYRPGKSIRLVRDRSWDAATDYRPAYLDSILIRTDAADGSVAARQVAAGRNLLLDTNSPPTALRQIRAAAPTLLSTAQSGGFRYFSLNTEVKPFNNINLRKAVMADFDRVAARRARGGADASDIATHFLPPDLPGFAEAGGYDGFPDIDYFNNDNASGKRALAVKYLKKAGYKSGRYEGSRRLLLVGANVDPGKAQIEVAARQLGRWGQGASAPVLHLHHLVALTCTPRARAQAQLRAPGHWNGASAWNPRIAPHPRPPSSAPPSTWNIAARRSGL